MSMPCVAVENERMCGEPSLTDAIGVCYDHAKLCVLCHEEPAKPETRVCPDCVVAWALGRVELMNRKEVHP